MFQHRRYFVLTAAIALTGASAFGQNVISAKSGLVHYVEGDVSIDGKPVADGVATFSEIKKDGELATALGRAEVLLTPGVFLRVGENTAIRMRATALEDTRVEFVGGTAMLESDTPMKDNHVTLQFKDYVITPVLHGVYEITSEPTAQLQVYSGEAEVTAGGQTVRVKQGRKLILTAALAQERFNDKDGDSLYRWSRLRSESISVANVSAARQAQGNGFTNGYGGTGCNGFGGTSASWYFNPFYNMYTVLPCSGMMYSPFGYGFYSPLLAYQYFNSYNPYGGYYSGGGTSNGSGSGSGAVNNKWQRNLTHPIHTGSPVAVSSHGSSNGGSSRTSSWSGPSSGGSNAVYFPQPSMGGGMSSSPGHAGFGGGVSSGGTRSK